MARYAGVKDHGSGRNLFLKNRVLSESRLKKSWEGGKNQLKTSSVKEFLCGVYYNISFIPAVNADVVLLTSWDSRSVSTIATIKPRTRGTPIKLMPLSLNHEIVGFRAEFRGDSSGFANRLEGRLYTP